MKKVDEPFRPGIKSDSPPRGINFRLARIEDLQFIFEMMKQRNPDLDQEMLLNKTKKEIDVWSNGKDYALFVATLDNEIVGISRYFHSSGLPIEKRKYPSPEGYYAMGTLVTPSMRRHGIAKYLSNEREKWLSSLGAKEIFSIVDAGNLTSIRMHQVLGYKEIKRARWFLNISFPHGEGILFCKTLVDA